MLIIGTSENPKKYYIKRVNHQITATGKDLTRIEFGTKNDKEGNYSNWRLTVWSNIECKEGEYVALKGISNIKITQFKANNGNLYVNGDITAHTEQVEIYEAQEERIASVSKETVLEGLPASASANNNGFSDVDLPF